MSITQDFIHMQGNATIDEVLGAYLDRDGQWQWLLVVEEKSKYFVCTFGSLLPYLVGKTPHIVHHVGECVICSAMDPLFWSETNLLVESVIEDQKIGEQLVSELPLAELPIVDDPNKELDIIKTMMMQKARACGIRTGGVMSGVYILQFRGSFDKPPQF